MDGSAGRALAGTKPVVNGAGPPPFLSKTYDMVNDQATDLIVSWGPGNNTFVVWNPPEFSRDLLPKYFKHSNFSSFVRQLNTYGFRKIDPDRWEFANEGFLRDQKHLLKNISRRKSSHSHTQPESLPQKDSVTSCVEVGKFGLDEEMERLKRDKNVLMQELVRLRQQQQATDNQLQALNKRIQGMEQRQQQMMSFLAKALNNPTFLAQLVQHNNANNQHRISAGSKKRRFPNQGELEGESTSADGQIVKYQPFMDSPHDLDSSRTSSSRSSGVTFLEEVPLCSRGIIPPVVEVEGEFGFPDFGQVADIMGDEVAAGILSMSSESDFAHSITGVDAFSDGDDTKQLPGIVDSFWEQFLSASPISVDTEEVNSSLPEADDASIPNMDHLTEQMGLLTSNSNVL